MAFVYWIRHPTHTDMFTQGYIGVTTKTVSQRWANHKVAAKCESKQHLPVYKAMRKYGAELIVDTVLEAEEDYVMDLERKTRPAPCIGWNVAVGGQATGLGRVQSQEERAKRALSSTGRVHTEKSKAKMSAASAGVPKSPAHQEKCRIAALGKSRPKAASDACAAKLRGRVKITEDGRKRLSEAKKALKKWEHSQANSEVWRRADEAFDFKVTAAKFSQRRLAKHFQVRDSQVSSLYEELKAGWIPSEDSAYRIWLTNFKESYGS